MSRSHPSLSEFCSPGLLYAGGLWVAMTAGVLSDDLQVVEQRIIARVLATLPNAATVTSLLTSLNANGSWEDINYADRSITSWSPRTHLTRLHAMARAYANPNHSLYENADLAQGILAAYDYWVSQDPQSDNWWYNDIATPQSLSETMLLIRGELGDTRLSAGLTIVARSYVPRSQNSDANTGANRVDRAYASLNRGLLMRNTTLVTESMGAVSDTMVVTLAEGIQPDFSFHQHGPQLMAGSYGPEFTGGVSKFAAFGAGTSLALPPEAHEVFVDFLLDGQQWFIRGKAFDYTAMGRSISRPGIGNTGLRMIGPVNDSIALGGHRDGELAAMKERLEASRTTGAADPTQALVGNRHFWRSDIMTHHRPAYYASVKTSSTRTYQPESGNGEGLQSLHLADGVNLIMQTGNEYDEIFPVWDWRRLPGTTTEQRAYSLKPSSDWGVAGNTTFVGGVSDGTYGATVMDYARLNVSAKKAWFFFDDEYIALGAGINGANAASPVITTLNQTLANGPVTYATTAGGLHTVTNGTVTRGDVGWVHHDGVGYLLHGASQSVTLRSVAQSGSWSAINQNQSNATVTLDVFSLQVNHGARPAGGTYAYVVVPGVSADAMASYAANVPLTVLENRPALQAVRHDGLKLTQAVFHSPGTLQVDAQLSFRVREPVLFTLHDQPQGMQISAANPRNEAMTLRADIRRAVPGGGDEFARITMRLPGGELAGQTVVRTLDAPVRKTDVAAFRETVAATPGLVHHYTFEGNTLAERLQDKVGNVSLQQRSYGSQGNVNDIVYAYGLDHSTVAMSPQRLSGLATGAGGAALTSLTDINFSTTLTTQMLVRPENVEAGGQTGFALMTGGWTNAQRGYFVVQQERASTDSLSMIIGNSVSEADNNRDMLGAMTPGHWYYVVNTYEVLGGNTIINSFLADITAGNSTLRHLMQDVVASGTIPENAPLGVGALVHGSSFYQAWSGSIDEIAIYNRVLDPVEIQGQLDGLYVHAVPEPSSVALLVGGLVGVVAMRRLPRAMPFPCVRAVVDTSVSL